MSRLFVGYMNKSKSQQGNYAVYDTMNIRSGQGATISGSGLAGYLDASPVSAPRNIPPFSWITSNTVRSILFPWIWERMRTARAASPGDL